MRMAPTLLNPTPMYAIIHAYTSMQERNESVADTMARVAALPPASVLHTRHAPAAFILRLNARASKGMKQLLQQLGADQKAQEGKQAAGDERAQEPSLQLIPAHTNHMNATGKGVSSRLGFTV